MVSVLLGVLAAGAAAPRPEGDAPPVAFHTGRAVFACHDKTPEAFRRLNPGRKIVEASVRVSADVAGDERQIEGVEYRFKLPVGCEVIDYLPKTTLGSEVSSLKVGETQTQQTVNVVALEGGASAGFRLPGVGIGAEARAAVTTGTDETTGRRSSVELAVLPPKLLVTAASTQDDGRVLHFKLKQRDQVTLQGDKDYVFLAEVPRDWSGACFTLECAARLKGQTGVVAAQTRTLGLYMAGDAAGRVKVDRAVKASGGWKALRAAVAVKPAGPTPAPTPEPAPLKQGCLPLDGSWTLKALLGSTTVEKAATIASGELRLTGDTTYWKSLRAVANKRYAAVRVTPGVFSNWEHDVEFYVDSDGTLRHDDSSLAPLHRSIAKLAFVPVKLDHETTFNRLHKGNGR